ncbi:hypothetical protein JAAARDRAFT_156189 [Jaapia argillacea MUCL 33604]|uniref:RNA helicase n=1 Tax=Jaapia argillacea MUCL 33604 TaxID=933084 RepID=A0A067Q4G9_9AGAM|nr:hypothetical protein JAAARDRAFT_156189 [Jaapia argillacea MUCL 33604]
MAPKRKLQPESDDDWESSGSGSGEELFPSDDDIDISAALIAPNSKSASKVRFGDVQDDDDDDDELQEVIRDSIAKRDVKHGTEALKKAKGKGKLAKGEVGGGSFQSMGLYPWLLRSLTLQGFRTPTPIQRLAIPALLTNPPRDLVGMARTGSGKSLAYLIPLIQRLGGRHNTTFGARALILLPTRELALQVLRVGKECARGWDGGGGEHVGDKEGEGGEGGKRGMGLRWGLVVGGEGMDEQFEMITNNPDVIIATPGRLLHLLIEMSLSLTSITYLVFDEADRLFEMGFSTALSSILSLLPPSRQTLLFSATLPKSLVEFAKAGLKEPKLVRLDSESKISGDLRMAFFWVRKGEKEAALLALLRDVIGVPFGEPNKGKSLPEDSSSSSDDDDRKKHKHKHKKSKRQPETHTAPHQTLIFTSTKHHVEYLSSLLSASHYSVSHIYGSLDQHARSLQMARFRSGLTNILVVTDVAARGIDIPVLENVVNYDFPSGSRVFVHRVGRTARAGRGGWAWSFVSPTELPYLLDLQLFLGRPLLPPPPASPHPIEDSWYTENLVLGSFERERIDEDVEYVRVLDGEDGGLVGMRDVMRKGEGMYERSRGKASQASYKRAKEMMKDEKWGLGAQVRVHPVVLAARARAGVGVGGQGKEEEERKELLKKVIGFRPAETVFEIGTRGKTVGAQLMKDRRRVLEKKQAVIAANAAAAAASVAEMDDDYEDGEEKGEVEMADEDDIAAVFEVSVKHGKGKGKGKEGYRDEEFYMSHYQKDAHTEKGYSLRDGASFLEQARTATFDLTNDESTSTLQKRAQSQLHWDKKKKKFIKGSGEGADNVKMIKTESGVKLPVSYRSGRFDEWKKARKVDVPRVGEVENQSGGGGGRGRGLGGGGRKGRHVKVTPAKPLDRLRGDYERKVKKMRKTEGGDGDGRRDEGERGSSSRPVPPKGKNGKPSKRYGGKPLGRVKTELKTVEQIRKSRKEYEKKKAKNARPSRKGGKGKGGRR